MVLGLSRGDADKYNAEFQLYDRMIPVYRENGIQAALLENSLFYGRDCTEEDLLKVLKRFHVAHLILPEQAVCRFDAPHQKRAAVVGLRAGPVRRRGRWVVPRTAVCPLSRRRRRIVLERRAETVGGNDSS